MNKVIMLNKNITTYSTSFSDILVNCGGSLHNCQCAYLINKILVPTYGVSIQEDFHYLKVLDEALLCNFILEFGEHIKRIDENV